MFRLLIFLLICSCSSVADKVSGPEVEVVDVKPAKFVKPENWADEYYQKTYFVVESPRVLESKKQLSAICKSSDNEFGSNYQSSGPHPIKYKQLPITVLSNKGFSKKTFVSKGACRELLLYKAEKDKKQIRKSIKSMTLIYIYNQGTYLKDLTFNTPYEDVKFLVE